MASTFGITDRSVEITAGRRTLRGILSIPANACGVVVFVHGSGSSRYSPRNKFVAQALQQKGLATLLIDLLEEQESENRSKVFDIPLLTERLVTAVDWLRQDPETHSLPCGFFGASTGAGAALAAAASEPDKVGAVVSRGGRPDLAGHDLSHVQAPTLLIVGGNDTEVIELNIQAMGKLNCPKKLVIVPGATHLFEESGTLEKVARLAQDWFSLHLSTHLVLEFHNTQSLV